MKKIITSVLLLVIAASSFAQSSNYSKSLTSTDYLKKSKNQKAAGWALLGGGALIDIIGIATFPKDYIYIDLWGEGNSKETESAANVSAALFVVGSAAMLGSIPFFISSRVNKKKSLHVTIDAQSFFQLKKSNMYTTYYPALTMKMSL